MKKKKKRDWPRTNAKLHCHQRMEESPSPAADGTTPNRSKRNGEKLASPAGRNGEDPQPSIFLYFFSIRRTQKGENVSPDESDRTGRPSSDRPPAILCEGPQGSSSSSSSLTAASRSPQYSSNEFARHHGAHITQRMRKTATMRTLQRSII